MMFLSYGGRATLFKPVAVRAFNMQANASRLANNGMSEETLKMFRQLNESASKGYWDAVDAHPKTFLPPSEEKRKVYSVWHKLNKHLPIYKRSVYYKSFHFPIKATIMFIFIFIMIPALYLRLGGDHVLKLKKAREAAIREGREFDCGKLIH